jgi:hypothetical protein
MKKLLDNIDYRVGCDDFFLYELGRLIDEDRASLEDDEFRRLIEAGVHEHIERQLDIRAEIAFQLRRSETTPKRIVQILENIEVSLIDVPIVVQSYTAYLFRRLETCADEKPDERIEAAADLLLESPEDRGAAEVALSTLGSTRSAVSARVLAHVVSEPMLDEDLENKAYDYVRHMWPLARPYILYTLKPHTHEDIPFRWFQLFVDCDEPSTVDRILEEIVVHAKDLEYREDLLTLLQLLALTKDPTLEEKVLQVLNSDETTRSARDLLEEFLKNTQMNPAQNTNVPDPWNTLDRLYKVNKTYLTAARLFDSGRKEEADRKLDDILAKKPGYPFAILLKGLIR